MIDKEIDSTTIVDTENLIGKCVVAGNVRRSAALALGAHDDMAYLSMKNDEKKLGTQHSHKRTESPDIFGSTTLKPEAE